MADKHSSGESSCTDTQGGVRRRDLLLSCTALVAAAALGSGSTTARATNSIRTSARWF